MGYHKGEFIMISIVALYVIHVCLMSGFVLYDVSLLIPYCILKGVLLSLGIYYPVFLHFTN